ncbi:hypothetical protein TNCV_1397371 [Trichonephila clavipes]|nr:hypothetical protein TNCV_1397371 [Trichonephila clavipes]
MQLESLISRGHKKQHIPVFSHNSTLLLLLLQKREELHRDIHNTNTNQARIELNKLNTEIKCTCALLKRKNWLELCKDFNVRCRCSSVPDNTMFSKPFHVHELEMAMKDLDLTKSPGPDVINGQMLSYLSTHARLRLLVIFNLS